MMYRQTETVCKLHDVSFLPIWLLLWTNSERYSYLAYQGDDIVSFPQACSAFIFVRLELVDLMVVRSFALGLVEGEDRVELFADLVTEKPI